MSGKRKREDSSPDVGLSAFAAARARVGAGKKQKESVGLDDGGEDLSRVATNASDGKAAAPLNDTFLLTSVEDDFPGSTDGEETQWDPQAIAGLSSNHNRQSSTENARPDSPHQQGALSLTFSLASAFNSTYVSIGQRIDLNKGQSLAIFGQFDLEVLEGAISIYGAILTKASGKRRVYPWSVDALPIIKTAIGQGATITLYHTPTPDERVDALGRLSPLFRFHNTADKPLPDVTYVAFPFQGENDLHSTETELRTIALQCNTKDKIQGFTRLNIPCTWLQEVAKISKTNRTGCIQLLGPFGVAETAFTTHFVNILLDRPSTHDAAICLLDLEFSHPMFGPPGQLSLVLLQDPLLGPPYTHPTSSSRNKIIKAHAVSRDGYRDDSEHFVAAVKDLVSCYNDLGWQNKNGVSSARLIVKHATWYDPAERDMSIEVAMLLDSSDAIQPSNILCFRKHDLAVIREVSRNSDLHMLELRPIDPALQPITPSITPAELHDMQLTSYFHSRLPSPTALLHWSPLPLSHTPPYTVSWSGLHPDILAIHKFGNPIDSHPTLLPTLLTANLVHILVLDPSVLAQRTILRSPVHDIPYFAPGSSGYNEPVDPRSCETVGVALVVGLDLTRKCFCVVTPVSESVLRALPRGRTVLMVGGFEAPGWAVMEDEWFAEYLEGSGEGRGRGRGKRKREDAPYLFEAEEEIELEGGVGMQAWRVRRFR